MFEYLQDLHPVLQAFIATSLTWMVTALGASTVFLVRSVSRKLLDIMLGFAAGVMIAASFWSLLAPSIELSEQQNIPVWFPPVIGFFVGIIFLEVIDRVIPHTKGGFPTGETKEMDSTKHRITLLVLAVTLHNIPEGLAVGVSFGAVAAGYPAASLAGAIALAMGIAIQNFPEGIAVSLPLRGLGRTRLKSFWYGQLSAVVEPIFGVLGAAAVIIFHPILPYALAFAAGAMIFVVIKQIVPESQRSNNVSIATMGAMAGFMVMMVLDVAFGGCP